MLLVVSCDSSPERNYSVPRNLCGLSLPKQEYSTLFGAGDEIGREDHPENLGSREVGIQGCRYSVEESTVSVTGEWVQENDKAAPSTPQEGVKAHNTRDKPRKYAGRYDVATWRNGAVTVVDCPRPPGDKDRLFSRLLLDIYANDTQLSDDPDRAHKVFGKLAQDAMGEVMKKLDCKRKPKTA